MIRTPRSYTIVDTNQWILDNGMFTQNTSINDLFNFMGKMNKYKNKCLFVTCPDVVGNAIATGYWYRQFAWRIKERGWPVAFVAQDGQESLPFPEFDALFIGGTTEWKLSSAADYCIRYAQKQGKWVHVGRVNSRKRIRHFQLVGVDSVDGTCICYGPDKNALRLSIQLQQKTLFTLEAQ